VAPGDQPVALTFDLCEQADDVTGYDRRIVNRLRDEGVRATFFAGGKWMRSHEEKAQQLMADPRFEIGNQA
jgi:peptidoglycan/xylan/chitin deacetylase (PgdA/CDA1 family)